MLRKTYFTIASLLLISWASDATELTWVGCGITKKAFMAEAAAAYEKKTGVKFKISGGGATRGVRAASGGSADMGGSCRPVLTDKFFDLEKDARMTVVAWDALVPIVNPNNPIKSISRKDLKKVLQGEITKWGELGLTGANAKKRIMLVVRTGDHSGVGFTTRNILFDFQESSIGGKDVFAKKVLKVKSSGPLEKKVEQKRWALGITGISSAQKRKVKIIAIDNVKPTMDKIARGNYFTFRPLYLMTKGVPKGETKKFMDWLLSEEGQAVIRKNNTVPMIDGKDLKRKFKHWQHTDKILNFSDIK